MAEESAISVGLLVRDLECNAAHQSGSSRMMQDPRRSLDLTSEPESAVSSMAIQVLVEKGGVLALIRG
jgi:hypothetical protein